MDKKYSIDDYYLSFGRELDSKALRLNTIIGDRHAPSAGTYKEELIKEVLRKFLPQQYRVASGFIQFPIRDEKNEVVFSRQLDVIVFDTTIAAPIFQIGDLVVLSPENVKAVVEVKGNMSSKDCVSALNSFEDLYKKYLNYYPYLYSHCSFKAPTYYVFAFNSNTRLKTVLDKTKTTVVKLSKMKDERFIEDQQRCRNPIDQNFPKSGRYFFCGNVYEYMPRLGGIYIFKQSIVSGLCSNNASNANKCKIYSLNFKKGSAPQSDDTILIQFIRSILDQTGIFHECKSLDLTPYQTGGIQNDIDFFDISKNEYCESETNA